MQSITYTDKTALNQNADISDTNKVNASDMNEIKSVVNSNANEADSKFTNLCDYSTSEVETGQTWIDGSPIYRKVINFGALPNNTVKSVNHNISDLLQIIKIETIGYDPANVRWIPIPFVPVASMYSSTSSNIRINATTVDIYASSNWTTFTAYVILEYTKSI